ncbi:MAG: hypothetical protein LKM31_17215 [Sphingobium sp.]|nr:hypothetical protein [Sphingobium sp.]
MAGASSDGEVNHWPAFVDVLTTVIMVVTFLLVIMSAAVMVLSQRAVANSSRRPGMPPSQWQSQLSDGKAISKCGRRSGAATEGSIRSQIDADKGTSDRGTWRCRSARRDPSTGVTN